MSAQRSSLTDPPSYIESEDDEALLAQEMAHLSRRSDATGHSAEGLTGLAISGGGIRSAIFSLGVLQSLARQGVLAKVDYLSTVSGGGYIGSSLSWLWHRVWDVDGRELAYTTSGSGFPYATHPEDVSDETRQRNDTLLDYLRRNRSYLLPGDGIGPLSLASVVLRGILLNALVYVPLLGAFFYFLQRAAPTYVEPLLPLLPWLPAAESPGSKMGLLFIAMAAGAFALIALASVAYALRTSVLRGKRSTYGYRRRFEQVAAALLGAGSASAVLASIPFAASDLESTLGAAAAGGTGIGAALGVLAFARARAHVLKRVPQALLVWVGAAALIYGVLLGAYALSVELQGRDMWLLAGALGSLFFGTFVNLNYVSLNRFYRDRLMETFMPSPSRALSEDDQVPRADEADATRLSAICAYGGPERAVGPYQLVNCNVVLTGSKDKTARARGGDAFVLSPLYCGSGATGWRRTTEFFGDRLTLASAMATSGAAINPNTGVAGQGPTRNPVLSVLLRMLNLRLGYWTPNPRRDAGQATRHYRPSLLWEGLFSLHDEHASAVELTDGGHFENLGLYELIRRRCDRIVLCDAAADPKSSFADFSNLLEKIRTDFGVIIEIDIEKLVPRKGSRPDGIELAPAGVVEGRILYRGRRPGKLYYLKTTLAKGLPEDVYGYKRAHPSFPDEPTSDQFFDELQFEAYRELGYQLGKRLMKLPSATELRS